MKVTHIIAGLDIGGAEIALKNIVEYSEKNGFFQNRVISLTGLGKIGRQLQELGIEVTTLGLHSFLQTPKIIYKITRILKKQNPDIVQTWMYHSDLIGAVAARFAGIKNILWGIRCTDVAKEGLSRSAYYIMKICSLLSYILPTKIICVAESALKTHQSFGYAKNKMLVIGNGCNSDIYNIMPDIGEKTRKELGIRDDTVVIGSVGRFNEYKDHNNFIKAAEILAAKNNNIMFIMLGRDINKNNNLLMQRINSTGFQERFILLGERSDGNKLLNAMNIFCLHSKSEAFPNVVVEAMCSGLPCVVTDVGDCRLIAGENAVIVPPQNHKLLAEALQKTVDLSEEQRIEIGRKARNHAVENYSLQNTVVKYANLYNKLIIS